jgi:hypothetical protein
MLQRELRQGIIYDAVGALPSVPACQSTLYVAYLSQNITASFLVTQIFNILIYDVSSL